MYDLLTNFANDVRTRTLLALIAADVVLSIAVAIRTGTFEWQRVATFYRTSVVPYVLGYLLVFVFAFYGLEQTLGALWGEITATVGVGPAVLALTGSIATSLVAFKTNVPKDVIRERQDAKRKAKVGR